jgi:predicted nuclease of restriction endonuclease-like RecB superfamily
LKKKLKNKFEIKLDKQLKRSKVSFEYESERIPYILARNYIPDFVVATPTGRVYIEAKGYLRPEHKAKLVAVKKQHPEKDIRIVFYAPNKKYEAWAIRHGFRYAFSTIPKDWINGL